MTIGFWHHVIVCLSGSSKTTDRSAIDVAAMAYANHLDEQYLVVDLIYDSIVPRAHAVG